MKVSVVLGAGFSAAAGLPVTAHIFEKLPLTRSKDDYAKMAQVAFSYRNWLPKNPGKSTEQWLLELYELRDDPLVEMIMGTDWDSAVKFALRRLAKPANAHPGAYYYGVSRHEHEPTHARFWLKMDKLGVSTVVTMNYDIMVERSLHERLDDGSSRPLASYGGFSYRQYVRKMTNVAAKPKPEHELVELGKKYLIYKLHGSLNWAWEKHATNMKIHDDVRAPFRTHNNPMRENDPLFVGEPAIVPPIAEKELPPEFATIWNQAKKELAESNVWIVCGYSLPPYDLALNAWFKSVLEKGITRRIVILDPNSNSLRERWKAISPANVDVVPLPGIPEALVDDFVDAVRRGVPHTEPRSEATPR